MLSNSPIDKPSFVKPTKVRPLTVGSHYILAPNCYFAYQIRDVTTVEWKVKSFQLIPIKLVDDSILIQGINVITAIEQPQSLKKKEGSIAGLLYHLH